MLQMSQRIAKQQAAQKERFEGILGNALLRWLNQIKKNDTDLTQFQDSLRATLNTHYLTIINTVSPRQLDDLNVELTPLQSTSLQTSLITWAATTALIRAGLILQNLQKWRNTFDTFVKFRARAQVHLRSVVTATEVQPTFENAKHETANFVSRNFASRKVPSKTWLTILDGRERLAHGEANGQEVPLSRRFLVGGELLNFPGDPSGSLPNIINCRCSLVYS